MTQEEKQLLLTDLSARLPYSIKLHHYQGIDCTLKYFNPITFATYVEVKNSEYFKEFLEDGQRSLFEYKPYLRPMSSMTEEERDELKEICAGYLDEWENAETVVDRWKLDAKTSYLRSAFYNSHHLDWNGLIEKGLALEATKGMYKTD